MSCAIEVDSAYRIWPGGSDVLARADSDLATSDDSNRVSVALLSIKVISRLCADVFVPGDLEKRGRW
jgi:hypothetical protein